MEGSKDFSCALDGSHESVKREFKLAGTSSYIARREQHTIPEIIPKVSPKSQSPLLHIVVPSAGLRILWFESNSVVNGQRSSTFVQHLLSDTDVRCCLEFARCLSRWKLSVTVSWYG